MKSPGISPVPPRVLQPSEAKVASAGTDIQDGLVSSEIREQDGQEVWRRIA